MKLIVLLKGVSKVFEDGTKALDSIDLEIFENEIVILSGISGSGKTTLIGLIAGLDRPSEGLVKVDNLMISKLPQIELDNFRQKSVGVVFQDFGLIDYMSVYENILAPLIPLNLKKDEAKKRVKEAMEQANISHKADTKVSYLSGGEKQRCAIARAIVNHPKIIICDEPTANLDLKNSEQFIKLLNELNSKGHTIIIATHDSIFEKLMPNAIKITISNAKIEKNDG